MSSDNIESASASISDEEYEAFTRSLGHLCMKWAILDRELNFLIGAMLGIKDQQMAAIATEMSDVAPRCRLIKSLLYTINVPREWRESLDEVCNIISNKLAPSRNRFVHDHYVEAENAMSRIDRRTRISRAQSFQEPQLSHDQHIDVDGWDIDELTLKALSASARIATARFDLEYQAKHSEFPSTWNLELDRVKQLAGYKIDRSRFE